MGVIPVSCAALSRNIIPSSHLSLALRVAFCHPALILQSLVRRSSLVTLVGSLPVIQAGSGRPFDAENLNMKIAGSLKFALPALLVLASFGALFFSERCHVIHEIFCHRLNDAISPGSSYLEMNKAAMKKPHFFK